MYEVNILIYSILANIGVDTAEREPPKAFMLGGVPKTEVTRIMRKTDHVPNQTGARFGSGLRLGSVRRSV